MRWPTAREELLLRAATGRPAEALNAWGRWLATGSLDESDAIESYSLLPAVYRNLQRLGADAPELARLKGIYRHTGYQNHLLLRAAADAVATLAAAGIETVVLKGAALLLLTYRDVGLRTMNDVDILVRPGHALAAGRALREAGWTCAFPGQRFEGAVAVLHAAGFTAPGLRSLDLHWAMLEECCYAGADDAAWAAAVPFSFEGVATRSLCATDLLLHVCVHGSRGSPAHVIHWVADAIAILRDAEC
ncbi:MAG: nucleotidyltransferase family protein, partial [Tepidiformaceae bacterium]